MISGSLSSSLDVEYIQIPGKFCEENTFPASIFSRLKKVIVVEKDTVFQRVIQLIYSLPDVICVTGKGYPDYATRKFLLLLQAQTDAEFYYIGDADPFGADIFFNYYFGSPRFGI